MILLTPVASAKEKCGATEVDEGERGSKVEIVVDVVAAVVAAGDVSAVEPQPVAKMVAKKRMPAN